MHRFRVGRFTGRMRASKQPHRETVSKSGVEGPRSRLPQCPKFVPHETLTPMTIAVTGASGFIGAALTERLRNDGQTVITIDIAGNPDRRADVADPAATVAALAGADAIVHAAAIVAERGHIDEFVRVNVRGTRNVLDAAGERRTDRARIGRRLGLRVQARAARGRPAAAVRAALRRHQGRRRDAGAAARRHRDPARRRLRPRLGPLGDPAAGDDARRALLPPPPGRRHHDPGLRRRPRGRDRAKRCTSRRRPAAPTRCGTARPSRRASTSSGSAAARSGRCPRRCSGRRHERSGSARRP